jgi:hypothetical protein
MRHMAPHPDDSPDRVRLEVGLQLRFHIRGSEPAGRGRGRGF